MEVISCFQLWKSIFALQFTSQCPPVYFLVSLCCPKQAAFLLAPFDEPFLQGLVAGERIARLVYLVDGSM
jgi:hypothetical protein